MGAVTDIGFASTKEGKGMRAKLAALIALTLLPGCTWTMLRRTAIGFAAT